MAGENSLGSKAMDYTSDYTNDALKICSKSHQLLNLPKKAGTLQLMHMQNYHKNPQLLRVHITAMQLIELSENMK